MTPQLTILSFLAILVPKREEDTKADTQTQDDESIGHKQMRTMSVAEASALLHLPKDFKK